MIGDEIRSCCWQGLPSLMKLFSTLLLAAIAAGTTVASGSGWSLYKSADLAAKPPSGEEAAVLDAEIEILPVRTTAYTHTEADHIKWAKKNAIGTTLQYGKVRSAAADWSKYPVGTKFRIEGKPELYVIDDYGSALVGKNTIDLYKPSRKAMNAWGAKTVKIEVIEWGCFERSLKILRPRIGKAPHIAKMARSLRLKIQS